MELKGVTFLQTTAAFEIEIDNENSFPLEIDGGVHRVYLNGQYLGKGLDKGEYTIPRLESITRTIDIKVKNLSLFNQFQSLLDKPKLDYKIKSVLYKKNSLSSISIVNEGEFLN